MEKVFVGKLFIITNLWWEWFWGFDYPY